MKFSNSLVISSIKSLHLNSDKLDGKRNIGIKLSGTLFISTLSTSSARFKDMRRINRKYFTKKIQLKKIQQYPTGCF